MKKRYRIPVTVAAAAAVIFLFCGFSSYGMTTMRGENMTVERGEIIEGDLFITGDTVSIDGTVKGDLYAAGETVTVRGSVEGVWVAAARVTVTGEVKGGLHAAGRAISVAGNVGEDLHLFGAEITVEEGAGISGDIITAGNSIMIRAPVDGYLLAGGRIVSLGSYIHDSATVAAQSLVLEGSAHIGGDLRYFSDNDAIVFSGALVDGDTIKTDPETREQWRKVFPFLLIAGITGKIFGFVMQVLVGLVFILFMPRFMAALSETVRRNPGPCAGWGALIYFGVPLGLIVATVIIVGIPFAIMGFCGYIVLLYLGQVVSSLVIGRLVLGRFEKDIKWQTLFWGFVLGAFLIRLFRLIPVAGFIVWAVANIFGIGALGVYAAKNTAKRKGTDGKQTSTGK